MNLKQQFRRWKLTRAHERHVTERALQYMEQARCDWGTAYAWAAAHLADENLQRLEALKAVAKMPPQRFSDKQLSAAIGVVSDTALRDALTDLLQLRAALAGVLESR